MPAPCHSLRALACFCARSSILGFEVEDSGDSGQGPSCASQDTSWFLTASGEQQTIRVATGVILRTTAIRAGGGSPVSREYISVKSSLANVLQTVRRSATY